MKYLLFVLEFGSAVSVSELVWHIPILIMMFLLKVAGDSWVSGTAISLFVRNYITAPRTQAVNICIFHLDNITLFSDKTLHTSN